MDRFVRRIITAVVSLFLLAYVGYQSFKVFYNPVKTETVNSYNMYAKVDTQGITVRNETLIPGETSGYLFYTIENGNRVSKDGTIAEVYPSEADSRSQQKIDALTEEITMLQKIEVQGTSNRVKLDVINDQISQTIGELTASVNSSQITGMDEWQAKLLELMNKRQVTIGKVTDFSDRIAELTSQKNALASAYSGAVSSITSPVAGYFVSSVDGFESSLSFDNVSLLTTSTLQTIMDSSPAVDQTGIIGKVVSDYKWYLACIVPAKDAGSLRVDTEIQVLLPFVTDEQIPTKVVAVNRDSSGNAAIIFECSYMSSALSSTRVESVQILLANYQGLRVPSNCIIQNEQGEQGVYTLVGDSVAFRKVTILHSEPDYVICEETDKSGYLKLYDELIVEGKGLYEGKVVR